MLNLIVAPKSYNKNAERSAKAVVKYLKQEKIEYSVYFSESFDAIKENVDTLISFGETEFVVVGDDVVISSILNTVKDVAKLKFGIIPIGSKNDLASYMGLETNPVAAIHKILEKKVEEIDLLLVNDIRVINSVLIGASVEVYEAFDQFKMQNVITQVYAENKFAQAFQGIEVTMGTKGSKGKTEKVFELIVANGGMCRGKKVSPLSNLQDGLFNLVYMPMELVVNGKKTIKLFNHGNHIYEDGSKQQWLTNIKITNADKKIKAIVDGAVQTFESLDISVVENALKIYDSKA